MSETRNAQTWCPTASAVVVLTVKGNVRGSLIHGEVADCNRYECKLSTAKGFCWIKKQIQTSM